MKKARLPQLWDQPLPRPVVRQRIADTSLAALDAFLPSAASIEGRILTAIRGAGRLGLTRKELKRRLDLEINVVCGRVDHLLEAVHVFEPLRSPILPADAGERARLSKDLHVQRNKQKIVVALEYAAEWPDSEHWIAVLRTRRITELARRQSARAVA